MQGTGRVQITMAEFLDMSRFLEFRFLRPPLQLLLCSYLRKASSMSTWKNFLRNSFHNIHYFLQNFLAQFQGPYFWIWTSFQLIVNLIFILAQISCSVIQIQEKIPIQLSLQCVSIDLNLPMALTKLLRVHRSLLIHFECLLPLRFSLLPGNREMTLYFSI